jgi:hypothetical protein
MIPYDKLTIVRNRHRARELRRFRDALETYFERAEYVAPEMPVDWDGVRAVRAEINQMLPRVLQVVHAAGLDARTADTSDPGPSVADVRILRNIFAARYSEGRDQAILDVIDMAIGVYEASRFDAMVRTVNPFHYAGSLLAFVAKLPRRSLIALGLWPRSGAPRMRAEDVARLEALASRFADADELIEMRFAEMRDRLAQQFGQNAGQVGELAERLDFLERVLAQKRAIAELEPP